MKGPISIMVDLDGVISTEERVFERPLAQLIPGAREALEKLKAAGHTIVVYTARGWAELKVTKKWLDDHGVPYDAIHMGKPIAHLWIDDRALRFTNWNDTLTQFDNL
jgi:ribonucleotide monophosphatase NagD (HAD superfamily)